MMERTDIIDPAMTSTPLLPAITEAPAVCPHKSRGGLRRLVSAAGYSRAGFLAAWQHEAAFRLELGVGLVLVVLAALLAPNRWQALLLCVPVLLVWIVELLNSALEAVADAVSIETRPLLGRAKDMASAAVSLSLLLVPLTWLIVFLP